MTRTRTYSFTEPSLAVAFDGTNDDVLVPDDSLLHVSTTWTIHFWLKRRRATEETLFVIDNGYTSFSAAIDLRFNSSNELHILTGNGTAWATEITSTAVISDTAPHMIDLVLTGGNLSMYVDGSLDNTTACSTPDYTGSDHSKLGLVIGRYNDGGGFSGEPFQGSIDDFAMFSSDKSGSVAGWWNGGLGRAVAPTESGLILLLPLEGTADDIGPNNLDGSLRNGAQAGAGLIQPQTWTYQRRRLPLPVKQKRWKRTPIASQLDVPPVVEPEFLPPRSVVARLRGSPARSPRQVNFGGVFQHLQEQADAKLPKVLVPLDPRTPPRDRAHQQVVSVILNSLIRRGEIRQVSPNEFKLGYVATERTDWAPGAPVSVSEALDRLAALLKQLNSGTGA